MPSIIIVGAGPLLSTSLTKKLASLGWNIALISRTESRVKEIAESVQGNIVYTTADAGDKKSLVKALEWCKGKLGNVDVLNYNASRVAPSDLMTLEPEEVEADFKTSAVGALVAGQWFAENANKAGVASGEYPLFLLTGGTLHKKPFSSHASLSTVKSAAQNIALNFSHVLPEKYDVMVGQALIDEPIIPKGDGTFLTKSVPNVVIDETFMPFMDDRMQVTDKQKWTSERVF